MIRFSSFSFVSNALAMSMPWPRCCYVKSDTYERMTIQVFAAEQSFQVTTNRDFLKIS